MSVAIVRDTQFSVVIVRNTQLENAVVRIRSSSVQYEVSVSSRVIFAKVKKFSRF